jgi:uncharacterized membrane protein YgcG
MLKLILICAFSSFQITSASDYSLSSPVNDYAKLLSIKEKELLTTILMDQYKKTNTQIAILTVNTLEGNSIEDFSMKMVNKYKLGLKGLDDGVLFVIAMKERKTRIEVGRGLEGTLTDLKSSHILRDSKEFLKNKKYYDGFNFIISNIITTINPDLQVLENNKEKLKTIKSSKEKSTNNFIFMFLFYTFFVFIYIFAQGYYILKVINDFKDYKLYKNAYNLYVKNLTLLNEWSLLSEENTKLVTKLELIEEDSKGFSDQIKSSNLVLTQLEELEQNLIKNKIFLNILLEEASCNPNVLKYHLNFVKTNNNDLLTFLIETQK